MNGWLKKFLVASLVMNSVVAVNAMASGYELVIQCPYVQSDDIENIVVYNVDGKGQVVVESPDGKQTTIDMDEEVVVTIEVSVPLPDNEKGEARSLQWRHTGWTINTFGQYVSREPVSCQ